LLGALSKAISTVLTYPLQLAQTLLRVQKEDNPTTTTAIAAEICESSESEPLLPGKNHSTKTLTTTHTRTTQFTTALIPPPYKGTLDCLVQIYRQKGMEGWFAGMRTKLLQTVLTAAFTFLTYEQIIRVIMAVHKALQKSASSRTLAAAIRG
jgi:solute carrier family 25 (peroxisomal adenine nucleotide transporter), member 17